MAKSSFQASLPQPSVFQQQPDLILVLDHRPNSSSRRQLVDWDRRCQARGGVGFICGTQGKVIAQLSRGLRGSIYNAGSASPVPVTELLKWLNWQRLVIIEAGQCWEVTIASRKQIPLPA